MASIIKRTDKPTIVRGMGSNAVLTPRGTPGPQGDVGPTGAPGGSDAAFAGWVNDSASETREALSASYDRLAGGLSTLTMPLTIAHRGGAMNNPENTMEAFRNVVAAGVQAIEPDCYLLLDGSVGVMHDGTVDRTTSSLGNTADMHGALFQNLTVDVGFFPYPTTLKAPLLDDVVREFGNKVFLVPEAKNTGSGQAIVDVLTRYEVSTDHALVQSFTQAELTPAINAGYPVMLNSDSATPSAVVAAGIEWVGVSSVVSQAYVQSLVAAGLKVAAYTVNRRYLLDQLVGWGASAVFSDDPIYVGGFGDRKTDPFAAQAVFPGHQGNGTAPRGEFIAPDWWGIDAAGPTQNYFNMHGWLKATDPTNFTLDYTLMFTEIDTADRWSSVWMGVTDKPYTDVGSVDLAAGYHFIVRATGRLDIYHQAGTGGGAFLAASFDGADIPLSTSVPIRITVTPTNLRITRQDNAETVGVDHAASPRGGHFTFGGSGSRFRIKDVSIT